MLNMKPLPDAKARKQFKKLDKDGGGTLDQDEFKSFWKKQRKAAAKQEKQRRVYFVCLADNADGMDDDAARRRWLRALQECSRYEKLKAELEADESQRFEDEAKAKVSKPQSRGHIGKEGMSAEQVADAVNSEVQKITSGLAKRRSRRASIEMNERAMAALDDFLDEQPPEQQEQQLLLEEEEDQEEEEPSLLDQIDDALDPSFSDAAAIEALLQRAAVASLSHPSLMGLQRKSKALQEAAE